jgi:hypothetical protein
MVGIEFLQSFTLGDPRNTELVLGGFFMVLEWSIQWYRLKTTTAGQQVRVGTDRGE